MTQVEPLDTLIDALEVELSSLETPGPQLAGAAVQIQRWPTLTQAEATASMARELALRLLEQASPGSGTTLDEAHALLDREVHGWRQRGKGWFEERVVRRHGKQGTLVYGPYRYLRWRDKTGRKHSLCLGRVYQQATPVAASQRKAPRSGQRSRRQLPEQAAQLSDRSWTADAEQRAALNIGVLISYIDVGEIYSNRVLRGIYSALNQRHGQLIIFHECTPQRILETRLGLDRVDGWISIQHTEGISELLCQGAPVVAIASSQELACPLVLTDNRGGVRAAVEHLIEHGHQRIAFIGWQETADLRERLAGYYEALKAHGLPQDPRLVIAVGGNSQRHGAQGCRQLLALAPDCSAIVAGTDWTAMGVIETLKAAGRRVPEDIAVIGFDNVEEARRIDPPLTTLHQPVELLGQTATELLLAQIEQPSHAAGRAYVPAELLLRRSCGCSDEQHGLVTATQQRGWQEQLERQLRALIPPSTPPGTPAASYIWPEVALLIGALEQALRGEQPLGAALQLLQRGSLLRGSSLETIERLLSLLEQSAMEQLGQAATPQSSVQVLSLLQQLRRGLLRAHAQEENARNVYLAELIHSSYNSYRVTFPMLEQGRESLLALDWLEDTKASWGCLGLWEEHDGEPALTISGVYGAAETRPPPAGTALDKPGEQAREPATEPALTPQQPHPLLGARSLAEDFPPLERVPHSSKPGLPEVVKIFPIKTYRQSDEWGFLAIGGANDTYHQHLGMWAHMIGSVFEREALVSSLMQAKQAAEHANQLKTQFLTTISHELRTPLNAIIGFADLLDSADSVEDLLHLRLRILANAEHLRKLINDILDLAKIEAGRLELRRETIDLRPLLESVLSTASTFIKEKPIDLRLDAPDDLPLVQVDQTRLRQVLLNLLSNAAKFTERGAITLGVRELPPIPHPSPHEGGKGTMRPAPRVGEAGTRGSRGTQRSWVGTCGCREAPGRGPETHLLISLRDTGIGIAPEHHALIFDEFRQVHSALTREYEGSGLGLSICKRLIELHGGTIALESSPGEGSTFSITLPVSQPAQPAARPPQSAQLPADTPLILLVDDSAANRDRLARYLNEQGYQIVVLDDGEALLRTAVERQPQLVIVNTQSQTLNGWALIGQLAQHPATQHIPVLISTLLEQQSLSLALGANGYLTKPLHAHEVQRIVRQWAPAEGSQGQTVLIVDDYPDAREILRVQLEGLGYRVLEAANGEEGLTMLRAYRPALVLLDLMMPKVDGFEVLKRLREEPAISATPVIVLTAQVLNEAEMARLNRGVATVLEKGVFRAEEILSHVEAVLAGDHRRGSAMQQTVRTAMAYIHHHYPESLSREQIAEYVGVSPRHLTRAFNQELGVTPSTYLTRYRITKAKELLRLGEMSVAQVAEATGFTNEFYFSRIFRRESGVTPSAYRRGQRESQKDMD